MIEIIDSQFGQIKVYYSRSYRKISLKFNPDGDLKITAPLGLSRRWINLFLNDHQLEIEQFLQEHRRQKQYLPGAVISKTCLLKLEYDAKIATPEIKVRPNFLVVRLPFGIDIKQEDIQALIRQRIVRILRREAKDILIPRLRFLAKQYGFVVNKISLGHKSSRWGSCQARTHSINLNIALVTLENDLIDYVLIHELCHLRQMNHSPAFWSEVGLILPNYQSLDRRLWQFQPHL